ncbi:Inner membrane symporter YicJ [Xanthomonas citri pv. bilvae]|nr:Inner membrane symporter YicJ [Xanthomonas citri pv. bilvae]
MPSSPATSPASARLRWREKLGYGAGDLGLNLYWANISAFLLIFYTDTMHLPAAAGGTMILLTKIADAIADPAMGALADRTRSRLGKFRPYLLWGALPMAAAGVLAYTTPDLDQHGRMWWATITFLVMMLAYTVVSIPYSALSGVITADSQQRTGLISLRFIGAFAGTTLVNYFTMDLVRWFGAGNDALGWQRTMLLYGAVALALFVPGALTTRERVQPPPQQRTPIRRDIADLLQNKPWCVLFVLSLIIMITITMRGGAGVYYLKYYVQRPDLVGLFLGSYSVALGVGAAITPLLTRRWDKRQLMFWLMVLVGLLSCAMFFVPADAVWAVFVLNMLIGLALGPKSPLAFSMYADSADYTEWRTGRRATAMTFAAATFSQKLGGALASAGIAWGLAAMGYVANTAQSTGSLTGIVLLLTVIPGAVALLAAWTMRFYPLDDGLLNRIQHELAARKRDEPEHP